MFKSLHQGVTRVTQTSLCALTLTLSLVACTQPPSTAVEGGSESISSSKENALAVTGEEGAYVSGDYLLDGTEELIFIEDPLNTEEYAHVDERGFITVKARPLSTISADVDTASFANLRRMLRDGYALEEIPKGAVRIEELLNYLDYDYPEPSGTDAFSLTAHMADCPWNSETKLLILGFATAKESTAPAQGSNLVFLVDVSGSMDSPDKLDLLKESFEVLVDGLGPEDKVSIVTYADGEEIVCEGVSGDQGRKIMRAIRRLQAEGCTNGERGLEMAYEVAERNYIEGGVNRIIMASDGDLNVGMSSESELHDFVEAKRETGVYLSVLGFGTGNYKDNKMETLADHGNGSYHYIDCVEEAKRVLQDRVQANLVPFADDVKVQLEFNPTEVKGYRLLGYENRELSDEDFKNDEVDAGDVGPNTQFTVAYEIVLQDSKMELVEPELKYQENNNPASAQVAAGEWLTASLRYRAFADNKVHEQSISVGASDLSSKPGNDWHRAAAVLELGLITRDSAWRGEASLEGAMAQLKMDTRTNSYSWQALEELIELATYSEDYIGEPGIEYTDTVGPGA